MTEAIDKSPTTGAPRENSCRATPLLYPSPTPRKEGKGCGESKLPPKSGMAQCQDQTPFPKKSPLILRQTPNPLFSEHCSYSFKLQGHDVEARLLSNLSLLTIHLVPIRWAKRRTGRWSWRIATSSSGWSHKPTVVQTVPMPQGPTTTPL